MKIAVEDIKLLVIQALGNQLSPSSVKGPTFSFTYFNASAFNYLYRGSILSQWV